MSSQEYTLNTIGLQDLIPRKYIVFSGDEPLCSGRRSAVAELDGKKMLSHNQNTGPRH